MENQVKDMVSAVFGKIKNPQKGAFLVISETGQLSVNHIGMNPAELALLSVVLHDQVIKMTTAPAVKTVASPNLGLIS